MSMTALRAVVDGADPDDLERRIGAAALDEYATRVTKAEDEASETIVHWWRRQPDDAVHDLIEGIRAEAPTRMELIEDWTGLEGADLVAEILRDGGASGARAAYERRITAVLTDLRTARDRARDVDPEIRYAGAVAGLDANAISGRIGFAALDHYTSRVAEVEYAAGTEIVRQWQMLPGGTDNVVAVLEVLERDHPEDYANAIRTAAGGPNAKLIAVLRDETMRPLYERLVINLDTNAAANAD